MDLQEPAPLVSVRTMNIVVAAILMIAAGIVITDSVRLGFGWTAEGPAPGYFPFYIGLFLVLASAVNLLQAVRTRGVQTFVTKPALRRVFAVLLPLVVYVAVLSYIGIYVASAVYVALFMWRFGRYALVRGAIVGVAVAVALFLMFEVWFLVPLPKGPVESMLGY
jgi:putative tricarboxylic transport membrane protein